MTSLLTIVMAVLIQVATPVPMQSTSYTYTGNNMANGQWPAYGYVACNALPLGTQIYVKELNDIFIVGDRIGHSSDLDIFLETYQEAIQYGRQNVSIYPLDTYNK